MTNRTRFMILLATLNTISECFSFLVDLERAQSAYDREHWWMKMKVEQVMDKFARHVLALVASDDREYMFNRSWEFNCEDLSGFRSLRDDFYNAIESASDYDFEISRISYSYRLDKKLKEWS